GEDKGGPVIIVDGKRVDNLNSIDPEDVEQMQVTKDPESEMVKKYKAENGVVIITLKEGVRFKPEKTDKVVAGRKTTEEIFIVVEEMPMFPGGLSALKSYIYDNLEYPEKARREGIEGKVTVDFVINVKGDVEDVSVSQSTYAGFEKAAMEVFKDMPRWEPGKQRGTPVKVRLSIPVEFKLGGE
ncbi:MAG: TonB family protein, partial [Bacteroidota bacterium]